MSKVKILIIDDYIPLLEDVCEYLTYEGFKTYSARDGAEGVQLALHYLPDVIVCDIEMPKMNGYQVFEALSKIPATKAIPFIFLTAKASVNDFKKGLQMGADDYIAKPFKMNDLLNNISVRLKKVKQFKEANKAQFDSLIKTPFVGIFIYIEDTFTLTNKKFEEITSYSKSELNNLKIPDIIATDKENVVSKLLNCLRNIQESVQTEISIMNKLGKRVYIDFFAIHVEIESKNAIIGSILCKPNSFNTSQSENQSVQNTFNKTIQYLRESGKNTIAEQIIEANEYISFKEGIDIQKIKKEDHLTEREIEILILICEGYTNNEIAEKLFISIKTVNNHRTNILLKTGAKNTALLVKYAIKNKYIEV